MPAKLNFPLLLDANIVFKLHQRGLWDQVVQRCDVHVVETVVAVEAKYFEMGDQHRKLDLEPHVKSGAIKMVSVNTQDVGSFRGLFKPGYIQMLDDGEAEALAYLVRMGNNCLISSADKIVWRVLGALQRRDQGVSLEEVLRNLGLHEVVEHMYTKGYREHWTGVGFRDAFVGQALK